MLNQLYNLKIIDNCYYVFVVNMITFTIFKWIFIYVWTFINNKYTSNINKKNKQQKINYMINVSSFFYIDVIFILLMLFTQFDIKLKLRKFVILDQLTNF